ncbi:nucleoside deaminase [Belnapia sp. T6]|uniref:Nucleoside deaminase n=1 Tax=Belnapia mucosa TaxID=2804532 RepID=A0ABS1UY69_9PROT|nr:nucleoside deaminase [Belnapia mucosa]MBL6453937.1 nucleoside deaminase [Belnapia mucosa]
MEDDDGMRRALHWAEAALAAGQAPFGAVVVDAEGAVLGEGHNTVAADRDVTAHAEVVALRAAWNRLGDRQGLAACTLYTSCEPCLMCSCAITQLGLRRVVFAARGDEVPGARRLFEADLTGAAAWAAEHRPGWRMPEIRGELLRAEAVAIMARYDWG